MQNDYPFPVAEGLSPLRFKESIVRVHLIGDEMWFLVKDVCGVLGLTNVTSVVNYLGESEKLRKPFYLLGEKRDAWLACGTGLVSYLNNFKNDSLAKSLRRWVTVQTMSVLQLADQKNPDIQKEEMALRKVTAEEIIKRTSCVCSEEAGDFGSLMDFLQTFNYEGREVRAFVKEGETWVCLRDICDILEIGNTSDVTYRLDSDEKDYLDTIDAVGKPHKMAFINESGIYKVIFVSRKPIAKVFQKWVTGTLLPTLRKTGKYEVQKEHTIETFIDLSEEDKAIAYFTERKKKKQAEELVRLTEEKRKALEEKTAILTDKIEEDKPKVEGYDEYISDGEGWAELSAVAKHLVPSSLSINGGLVSMGRNSLIHFLVLKGEIFKRQDGGYEPYQKLVSSGFYRRGCRKPKNYSKDVYFVLVSPSGTERIRKLLKEENHIIGANLTQGQKDALRELTKEVRRKRKSLRV